MSTLVTRSALPGEGPRIRFLLYPAARTDKDREDLEMWCDMLDLRLKAPVEILVLSDGDRLLGAVLLRRNGLRCEGFGWDQIDDLNHYSLYVPFLAVEPGSPYGCGKLLGDAAIQYGRENRYRALTLLVPDERLLRYYRRLWPRGIFCGPGEVTFFLRTPMEDVLFPELFRMTLPEGTWMGVCPLVPGVREETFPERTAVVGMTEDYRPEYAELSGRVSDLLKKIAARD